MQEGLYESLLTRRLQALIDAAVGLEAARGPVDEADQPEVLARHLRDAAHRALSSERTAEGRRRIVNTILAQLDAAEEELDDAPVQLLSLARPSGPGTVSYRATRPSTPLSDAALLTNSHGEPSLGAELRAELDTADRVDLLCAFVKWSGLRILEPELARARERGVPIRVITTTYVGATERTALDRLVRDYGAEVRVEYDALRTRLHAKAWLFRRRTEFDTAYVGSSNLSRAALLDGVEWNVRLSAIATPGLMS